MDKKKLKSLIAKHLPDTEDLSDAEQNEVEETLGLKPVTIRFQEDLIKDLKKIAKKRGLKYQAYVRFILTEHVNNEKKAS